MAAKEAEDKKAEEEFVLDNDVKAFRSELGLQDAYDSIFSVAEVGSSTPGCIKPLELKRLLKHSAEKEYELRAYDGFEPSGRMHIAQGLMRTINVNKFTRAGIKFVFYVADWFAQLNNKFEGDLVKIREVGQYFVEVWKACGMDLDNVEFVWASDEINKRSDEYWPIVMDLARHNSVSRVRRCGQIMGRKDAKDVKKKSRENLLKKIRANKDADANLTEDEFLDKYSQENTETEKNAVEDSVAQLLYPLMQCTDIFFLNARICQLGMDQVKVNVLAREYASSIQTRFKRDKKKKDMFKPPIVISHHMLMGLKEGQAKMSKSDPNSAIFMEDTEKLITSKVMKAFCRPGDVTTNPVLDYVKHIVFPKLESDGIAGFAFDLPERDGGGSVSFATYAELEAAFAKEELHPSALKPAVAKVLNDFIRPVREYFEKDKDAKKLLARISKYKQTK